ncbi:MAG: prepilin-type N-terminal cleavage/methylation domain-containing protein [Alphaproteobacteria bacterium]|nr:prepilin-type N-terminal cleavage/methylation domain-containing protein [Alphaproteobacteria bacterium]
MTKKQSRAGFTLVELSIVLVIIGLIIGGVLTGRQIMQNAQITNALNSIQAFQAQFQTYVQNYGAIPGDDINNTTRFPNANLPGKGDGSGTLNGEFDSGTNTDETRLVWGDLRAADLVKNQGTAADITPQPTNPFNGIYGFQHTAFTGAIASNVLCLTNVPADAAMAIDSRLDDGSSNTGSIQAMISTGAAGEVTGGTVAADYGKGQTFTLCVRM